MFSKHLQRFGTDGVGSGAPRDLRYVRDEMNDMEHQISDLQRDLKDRDRQLAEERQKAERVTILFVKV